MAVPIHWQDPFSSYRSPLFVSKYFSSLGEDEKFILKECLEELGINEEFPNTLFDYARFLKVLDLWNLEIEVRQWITFKLIDSEIFYEIEMYHIINLLFKLFIESGANKQFFSRIQYLSLEEISDNNIESTVALLKALAKSTKKISTIELDYFDSDYEPQIFHALIYIIKSQEQLRLFSLVGDYSTEFHGIILALEKTLRIRNCSTKPLKLLDYKVSTLEVDDCQIDAQAMILIFEKSGILLQRLKFETKGDEFQEELLLLEALKFFCPNITYLSIYGILFSQQVLEPIEILPLTLQYFILGGTWLEPYTDILFNHCNAPLKKMGIYHLNKRISKALVEFCKRNKTLNYVGVFKYLGLDDNTKKELETYVELVPYNDIVVDH
ncbi:hypothetical protein C2G38_2178508 [Gigaspora rosea]|uniref:F-box domain-containing protein n=1 Tax=Gigaspora rosea TaxID=44941 RepID=A0A397VE46_9GLOM|nr:hypothetical protein C2G38_2178508 [Gigaspora rosea]